MAEMQPAMTRAQFDLYANRLKMAHPTVAALEMAKMEASEGFVLPTNLNEWTHQARPLR